MNTVRINLLGVALIGAAFVVCLAAVTGTGPDTQLAQLAIGGTFAGAIGTSMIRLVMPDPDPSVPASVVEDLLTFYGTGKPPELKAAPAHKGPSILLWLAIFGAVVVLVLTFLVDSDAAIVTVAGGFVGGLVALMSEMVKPPPNPEVPASVVHRIIDAAGIQTGPGTRLQSGMES